MTRALCGFSAPPLTIETQLDRHSPSDDTFSPDSFWDFQYRVEPLLVSASSGRRFSNLGLRHLEPTMGSVPPVLGHRGRESCYIRLLVLASG